MMEVGVSWRICVGRFSWILTGVVEVFPNSRVRSVRAVRCQVGGRELDMLRALQLHGEGQLKGFTSARVHECTRISRNAMTAFQERGILESEGKASWEDYLKAALRELICRNIL